MHAVDFLLKEHATVRATFKEISNDSHRYETKRKMFDELCENLKCHEKMEQTKWYPHLQKNPELKKIIDHLLEEEKKASEAISDFKHITDEAEWEKKFSTFHKDVDHHANEEEEKLFPKVKDFFEEKQLEEWGLAMHQFKIECLKK